MHKLAYQFGVWLALRDAGLFKSAAVEVDPSNEMPQRAQNIPAEALAMLMREDPDIEPSRQTEAIRHPNVENQFTFGFGSSSYSPLSTMGFDIRAPTDTSI